MRSTEERVAAVKERIARQAREKALRRSRVLALASVAAALSIIVGMSFYMPGLSVKLEESDYAKFQTTASIFGDSSALGYVVIGLLAFILGVCVTVLCFRLRLLQHQGNESESRREDGDG